MKTEKYFIVPRLERPDIVMPPEDSLYQFSKERRGWGSKAILTTRDKYAVTSVDEVIYIVFISQNLVANKPLSLRELSEFEINENTTLEFFQNREFAINFLKNKYLQELEILQQKYPKFVI